MAIASELDRVWEVTHKVMQVHTPSNASPVLSDPIDRHTIRSDPMDGRMDSPVWSDGWTDGRTDGHLHTTKPEFQEGSPMSRKGALSPFGKICALKQKRKDIR